MSAEAKEKLIREYERCLDILNQTTPDDGGTYCPPYWDTWGCWNYTRAGTVAVINCPSFIDGFDPTLNATRRCEPSGEWWTVPNENRTWSNYTTCVNMQHIQEQTRVVHMYVTGYTLSILCLIVALFIFSYFKQLRCTRVTIHMHLFVSYILTGAFFIYYYTYAALNPRVLEDNSPWCQFIHVITQYMCLCNFYWMFCEGLYLHTVIVIAFTTGKKLMIFCCCFGWGFPVVPTLMYAITRSLRPTENDKCWLNDSELQWIIFAPIIATLLMNVVILCNVVRVLITKMRATNSPYSRRTRKAVRAAVILIPLLGLQFILFPVAPKAGTLAAFIYQMVAAFVASFQGTFVAVILCFLNGEVIEVLQRRWDQRMLMSNSRSQLSRRSTNFMGESQLDPSYRASRSEAGAAMNGRSGDSRRASALKQSGSKPETIQEEARPVMGWAYEDTVVSLHPGPDEEDSQLHIVQNHAPPAYSEVAHAPDTHGLISEQTCNP